MADKCVVRNEKYRRGGLNKRERHNERKNMNYQNEDIDPARSHLNVHFKSCESGYAAMFDRMVSDGVISTRGLGKDPYIVDELVFDVNSAYFEKNGAGSPCGSYEYAKRFFEEAYRCAVGLIGGEQYVLSAVMHADERNKALSEQAGHDVHHYHLHVVYIPVVEKKVYFRKNNKDPALAGTLKEVITQVSHSKKWPRVMQTDEQGETIRNAKGKAVLVNSYSLMQDRFFEHMQAAGFTDFERGKRGSTAEHLSMLEYKSKQESERATALNKQVEQRHGQLTGLEKKITVTRQTAASFAEIDAMGEKKTLGGNVQLSPERWNRISGLAKEGVKSRGVIRGLQERMNALSSEAAVLKSRLAHYGEGRSISEIMRYYQAAERAPRRMAEAVAEALRQPPEPEKSHESDKSRPLIGAER